jgi:hypothetical protein
VLLKERYGKLLCDGAKQMIVILFNLQLSKQTYETPRRISTAFASFIVKAVAAAGLSLC